MTRNLLNFFQNTQILPETISESLKLAADSECPEVLCILLKYMYKGCCLENAENIKEKIKDMLHGNNEGGNTLFTRILKNKRLLEAQSLILCIEFEFHESVKAFENYFKEQFDGEFVKKNNVKRQQEYENLILFQCKDGN